MKKKQYITPRCELLDTDPIDILLVTVSIDKATTGGNGVAESRQGDFFDDDFEDDYDNYGGFENAFY